MSLDITPEQVAKVFHRAVLMRILLIKMSSLGDVIHTFPALSDIQKQVPQ